MPPIDETDELFQEEELAQAQAEADAAAENEEEQDGQEQEGEGQEEETTEDATNEGEPFEDNVYEVRIPTDDGDEEAHEVRLSDLPNILTSARKLYYEREELQKEVVELRQNRDLGLYVARDPLLTQLVQYKLQGGSDKDILEKTYLYMQENNLFNEGQQGDGQQTDPQIGQLKSELEQLRSEREAERQEALLAQNYEYMGQVFQELGYETDGDAQSMQKLGRLFGEVANDVITEVYGKKEADAFLKTRKMPATLARQIWHEVAARNNSLVRKSGTKGAAPARSPQGIAKKAASSKAMSNPPIRMTGANRGVTSSQTGAKPRSSDGKGSTDRERAEQFRKLGL